MRVVVDTNVVIAAFRSSTGASDALLRLIASGTVQHLLSVPLALEYEEQLLNAAQLLGESRARALTVLEFLIRRAEPVEIFFKWEAAYSDRDDNIVIDLSIASNAAAIVTHNIRDFDGARKMGLVVMTPKDLLDRMRQP